MITTSDIANILIKDCKVFGIKTFQKGNVPTGEITEERIVVIAKKQSTETYWNKDFVEVNFCIPDKYNEANLIRLNKIEREAVSKLKSVGEFDGSYYRYSVESHSIEEDVSMKCHYVNIRLLFEVLNVK